MSETLSPDFKPRVQPGLDPERLGFDRLESDRLESDHLESDRLESDRLESDRLDIDHNVVALPSSHFTPHRWLGNGHLQTIVAVALKTRHRPLVVRRRAIELPDGDCMIAHECGVKPSGGRRLEVPGATCGVHQRLVLMFHGLGGSFRSSYMQRVGSKLAELGVGVWGVDLRGCGEAEPLCRGHHHAGRDEDLFCATQYAARWVAETMPQGKITLIGFSLSGNALLKMLGTKADQLPRQVDQAIAVCPPVDLNHCSWHLRQGAGRYYDYYYTRNMMRQLLRRRRLVKQLIDWERAGSVDNLWDFDNKFTAPLNGYRDARDYYTRNSSANCLHRIQVPTRVLVAADDPVVPSVMFHRVAVAPCVELTMTDRGGHLGYYSDQVIRGDRWWMDWRIIDWVLSNSLVSG